MTPQGFGMTALNQLTSMLGGNSFAGVTGGLLTNTLNLSQQATSAVNGAFQFQTGNITWSGFVDALQQENIIKVLAKPTLMALNGQEAAFLAGGEFPIPVPQAFGLVTIQFKKFGVGLVFTPNIMAARTSIGQWYLRGSEQLISGKSRANGTALAKDAGKKTSFFGRYLPSLGVELKGKPSVG